MRLSLPGPVKRSRATLESDSPRDNRIGWRWMSTRGSRFPLPHPTATKINIQSFPPCLINSGGVGAEPPRTVAERQCSLPGDSSLFAEGKIPFHAEPRQFVKTGVNKRQHTITARITFFITSSMFLYHQRFAERPPVPKIVVTEYHFRD